MNRRGSLVLSSATALMIAGACAASQGQTAANAPSKTLLSTNQPGVAVPAQVGVKQLPVRRPPLLPRSVPKERAPLSGAAFLRPPPWPAQRCVSHAMVWSLELEERYVPGGVVGQLFLGPSRVRFCGWGYSFGDMGASVALGEKDGRLFATARASAKRRYGMQLPTEEWSTASEYRLRAWNDDPPYFLGVSTTAPTAESKKRVIALIKDLARQLTTEHLSHPMAQLVTVYRGKNDERARRLLTEWPYLKAAFDHIAPLAPGYPRLQSGATFSGDIGKAPNPDDQFLSLGVCPPPVGEYLQHLAEYLLPSRPDEPDDAPPPAEALVVDGAPLTVECPNLPEPQSANVGGAKVLADGNVLTHAFSEAAASDPVGLRGAVILRSRNWEILDIALYEIPRPVSLHAVSGRYQAVAHRRVLPKCGGYAHMEGSDVQLTCQVEWSDMLCRGIPESTGSNAHFTVTADQRIEIATTQVDYLGESCIAKE